MTARVLCQATVDPGESDLLRRFDHAETWLVTVTGQAPHDQRRVYRIPANSDNAAAREGIARFVAEMEAQDPMKFGLTAANET